MHTRAPYIKYETAVIFTLLFANDDSPTPSPSECVYTFSCKTYFLIQYVFEMYIQKLCKTVLITYFNYARAVSL